MIEAFRKPSAKVVRSIPKNKQSWDLERIKKAIIFFALIIIAVPVVLIVAGWLWQDLISTLF